MKDKPTIRILNVGDLHGAHNRTPTEHIVNNFERLILNKKTLDKLDILFIAGDVFDKQITYDAHNTAIMERFITNILINCAFYNVILRVVEGTPGHDYRQSSFFTRQKEMAGIDVDVKWVDKLSIESIEALGISVLYVPDKWRPDTQDTLDEVKGLLAEHQLTQVDFALMHGAFDYQLPAIVKEPAHNQPAYEKIVKHLIFIGHVHTSVPRGKVVPSGSFDRLAHGEEEAKGYHIASVNLTTNAYTLTFHENKRALIYKTLDVKGLDEKAVWALAESLTKDYPKGSYFRFQCQETDSVIKTYKDITKHYPDWHWEVANQKSRKEKDDTLREATRIENKPMDKLNADTLKEQMKRFFIQQGNSEDDWASVQPLLEKGLTDVGIYT